MTRERQLEVLRFYDDRLSAWEPAQTDKHRDEPVGMGRGVKHARWMILEMIRRLEDDEESSPGQADRWIGFIQAILWSHGLYSIADMAEHNVLKSNS